jgi:hypothetical protein
MRLCCLLCRRLGELAAGEMLVYLFFGEGEEG